MGGSMAKATIKAQVNGSLQVTGPVQVESAKGDVKEFGEGEKTWLCRCGHSENKPYCDGTHKKVGFRDPAEG
jgi:CDGSH-type Zn-finger protein